MTGLIDALLSVPPVKSNLQGFIFFFGSLAPSIFPYEVRSAHVAEQETKLEVSGKPQTFHCQSTRKNSNAWAIKTTELIKTQQHTLKIICHWHNDSLCLLAAVRTFVVQVARWKLLTDRLIILFINYYLFLAAKKKTKKPHNKSGRSWVKRFNSDMFPIQTQSLLYGVNLMETKSHSAEQQALILQAHAFPAHSRPDFFPPRKHLWFGVILFLSV